VSSWTKGDPQLARRRAAVLLEQLPHALSLPALVVVAPLEGAPVVASTDLSEEEQARLAEWCETRDYPRDLVRLVLAEQDRQLGAGAR